MRCVRPRCAREPRANRARHSRKNGTAFTYLMRGIHTPHGSRPMLATTPSIFSHVGRPARRAIEKEECGHVHVHAHTGWRERNTQTNRTCAQTRVSIRVKTKKTRTQRILDVRHSRASVLSAGPFVPRTDQHSAGRKLQYVNARTAPHRARIYTHTQHKKCTARKNAIIRRTWRNVRIRARARTFAV